MGLISRVSSRTYRVKMSQNKSGESRRLDYEAKVRSRWEPPTHSNPIAPSPPQATVISPTATSPTSTEFVDYAAPAGIVTKPDTETANSSNSNSPQKSQHRLDPATRLWAAGLRSDLHNPPPKSNDNKNSSTTRRTRSDVTGSRLYQATK